MIGKFYLYRHIREDKNEPFYVGIGSKPKVYNGHRTEYKRAYTSHKRSKFWKNVAGKTSYRVEIMLESDDLDFIKEREVEFITLYGRKDQKEGTLVNLTEGGELNNSGASKCRRNFTVTPEQRKRHSEAMKGLMVGDKNHKSVPVVEKSTGKVYGSLRQYTILNNLDYDRTKYLLNRYPLISKIKKLN
jgi:hypothetical protein